MLIRDIKIPIYNTTVKVYLDDNLESLKKQLTQIDAPFSGSNWEALTTFNDNSRQVGIYITTEDFLGDLHHECIHAANYILENVGIPISTKDDEVLTYLSTFIFKEGLKIKEEFEATKRLSKVNKSKKSSKPITNKNA